PVDCGLAGEQGGQAFRHRGHGGGGDGRTRNEFSDQRAAAAQRQRAGPAACGAGRHRGDAARAPAQGRAGGADADPARRDGLLDRRRRRRAGRGAGDRLPRGGCRTRLGDAAAGRPQSAPAAAAGRRMAEEMSAVRPGRNLAGIGMTSQRTRERMVERLREQGIGDARVLAAMAGVPRHLFVEEALASRAYEDTALPIGFGQTISQPFVVARMIETLITQRELGKVLEVGTGCGYQAAVLASLATEVYSIERIRELLDRARANLRELRLKNLRLAHGDGAAGLEKAAPFDSIIVAAAAREMPQALLRQLARGGRMILPLREPGAEAQRLVLVERSRLGYSEATLDPVRFVPLQPGKA